MTTKKAATAATPTEEAPVEEQAAQAPAPTAPPAVDTELPVATRYDGDTAYASRGTATLAGGTPTQWWVEADMVGKVVPVVHLEVHALGRTTPFVVWVYDGDGTGSAKFIDGGGFPGLEHREVLVEAP